MDESSSLRKEHINLLEKTKISHTENSIYSILKNSSKREKEQILYRYILLRGRLRLGKIVNACHLCLFILPCTLGLGLWFWSERVHSEVLYHLDELHVAIDRRQSWLILVPGLHFILYYRLAKLILQMESKHQYHSVSPFLATILAFLPPLSTFYLQCALNRHWTLHLFQPHSKI